MEKVIKKQVFRYLESNSLIPDRQCIRQQQSTSDVLTHVTHIWNYVLKTSKEKH